MQSALTFIRPLVVWSLFATLCLIPLKPIWHVTTNDIASVITGNDHVSYWLSLYIMPATYWTTIPIYDCLYVAPLFSYACYGFVSAHQSISLTTHHNATTTQSYHLTIINLSAYLTPASTGLMPWYVDEPTLHFTH
jgi:hypothetical protein